jgi:predicted  nucleic acid-binding Zn-ribbon protein
MFRPRFVFQTRSADRDRQTDQGRRQAIAGVLARQRADVDREMAGLQRRMDDAYQRAVALLANSEDYGERSTRDEEEIVAFEASAEAARNRIADLSRQLEVFEAISKVLDDAGTGPDGES